MKLTVALVATALTVASVAPQTPPQRGKTRQPGAKAPPADVPVSIPRSFAMRNGMRVTLMHTGTARKVVVALVLATGEIDEPKFGPGLASLTAQMLLQGSVARSAQRIVAECAELGTKLAVQAGPVTTSLTGEVDAVRMPRFLALIGDLVRHPLLDTAGFGRVQRDAMRTLDSTLRDPGDLARQQWRAIIFPDGPFGHPYAYPATIGMLKLGHVRNVYDDNYSASRAHLYVSGGFDDAATEKNIRETFGDWPPGIAEKPVDIRPATVH
ncbi:MAG: insulinase family protein, partial [Thermoplasmata archaeon]